jgi:hypothetical protein
MKISHLKETTPSLWWKEVERISGMTPSADTKNPIAQLHLENVEADIQGVDLANRINNAFLEPTRIYQPLDPTTIERDLDHPTVYSAFELATEMVVYNILSKLNPRKALGLDCLPNWLLKTYAEILARPICSILNSSLFQQKLPSVWKHADVIPVPKQKPITIINKHLRLISLTPNVSKVAEEFVVSKYIAPAVLEIIDPDQYGAIPKSSTIHALVSMIHQWAQATDGTGSAEGNPL